MCKMSYSRNWSILKDAYYLRVWVTICNSFMYVWDRCLGMYLYFSLIKNFVFLYCFFFFFFFFFLNIFRKFNQFFVVITNFFSRFWINECVSLKDLRQFTKYMSHSVNCVFFSRPASKQSEMINLCCCKSRVCFDKLYRDSKISPNMWFHLSVLNLECTKRYFYSNCSNIIQEVSCSPLVLNLCYMFYYGNFRPRLVL